MKITLKSLKYQNDQKEKEHNQQMMIIIAMVDLVIFLLGRLGSSPSWEGLV